MINRIIREEILSALAKKKAVSLIGPRQVGKSTLVREMFGNEQDALFLSGDEADVRSMFHSMTSTRLKAILGNARTVIIDEAQKIEGIGNTLKLITDYLTGVNVIATGSSSFRLGKEINESLAGRKREIRLYPLSFSEMVSHTGLIEERRMLGHRLVYGCYPEVITSASDEKSVLKELVDSYLFKDIFEMDSVAKPDSLVRLLQALSFQIGSQVSYNELSQLVGIDAKTVSRYIEMLERNFVVFRLPSFSRNLRNELKFSRKIYFYDLGVRNAVINNFAPVELRSPEEMGRLWENYMVSERLKSNEYGHRFAASYFWRTEQQKEIDLIEEMDGQLEAFEFKWNQKKHTKIPPAFSAAYPEASFHTITPDNYEDFLLSE